MRPAAAAAIGALALAGAHAADSLPALGASDADMTVSGVSSGAFMAVQLHVAYSKSIAGAGVIAGGPYYCAQADVELATTACMTTPALIDVDYLETVTRTTELTLTIDPVSGLKGDRVWLYSGANDTVVDSGVVQKLQKYYSRFLTAPGAIQAVIGDVDSEHAWITQSYGNACGFLGEPYINACGYDAAGEILQHLFDGALTPPAAAANQTGELLEFGQREFVDAEWAMEVAGLADSGFAYVPPQCSTDVACHVHVALHGCEMGVGVIGDQFARHSGLNEWADANDFVVLYPQARKTADNPKGCYDWFAYTGVDYASNLAVQMRAVRRMMTRVTS